MTEAMLADLPAPRSATLEGRREQVFPHLSPAEIDRLRRFGELRTYAAGEHLASVGDPGLGLFVMLCGAGDVSQRLAGGQSLPILTHEAGGFLGELAQLSGRGFIITDRQASPDRLPLKRSRRGVFAVGDVRAESVKRVAAAGGRAQVVASNRTFLTREENGNG